MAIEALFKAAAEVTKEVGKNISKGASNLDKRKTNGLSDVGKISTLDKAKDIVDVDKRINSDGKDKTTRPEAIEKDKLSPKDIAKLLNIGISPGILDKIECIGDVFRIKTDNYKLADQKHPNTNVPFKTKIVDILGTKIEGVFPEFKSKFDTVLPEDKIRAKDKEQFDYCNQKLKDAIQKNPKLRQQFTERQIAQIEGGHTPSGYLWHHNEERGKMQLVDAREHQGTSHTGGRAIWGGGKDARS